MAETGHIHVAAAALNQTVGDWRGNVARITEAIEVARGRGARLLVLPEMSIPGYSLGDRLLREGTLTRSWEALVQVAEASQGIVSVVGLPVRSKGVIYNAMAVVSDGKIHGLVAKENLATGDVEYESRWYQAWPAGHATTVRGPDGAEVPIGNVMFRLGELAVFGVEVCEDGWMGFRPGSRYTVAGAEVMLNPSASWFMLGKHAVRRRMVEQISLEDKCLYVYTSLMGCDATRLVFDGSCFVAQDGQILREGSRFVFGEDVQVVDAVVDLNDLRQKRMESGSWRQQVMAHMTGAYGPSPQEIMIEGSWSAPEPAAAAAPYWLPPKPRSLDPSLEHLVASGALARWPSAEELSHVELELALCMGLRDYMRKTASKGYCLALSGGRDSAMVAVLVHRMFAYMHPELDADALRAHVQSRFACAYLGTEHSSKATRDAARAIAHDCGARFLDADVGEAVGAITRAGEQLVGEALTWEDHDIPLQNVQARARGSIIWLVANVYRFILLTTSNKSEAAVGYATMDGDTSGGLAPIADVPKSLIQIWLAWARRFHAMPSIDSVLTTPSTAELRPQEMAQTDEDDLMPFVILDQLMDHFIQRGLDPLPIFKTLWPSVRARYSHQPRPFADHIARFTRMLCRAQWKRERFAIAFRVTAFDLDPKTGFRFPPVQKGFEEELEELYAYVAKLEAAQG